MSPFLSGLWSWNCVRLSKRLLCLKSITFHVWSWRVWDRTEWDSHQLWKNSEWATEKCNNAYDKKARVFPNLPATQSWNFCHPIISFVEFIIVTLKYAGECCLWPGKGINVPQACQPKRVKKPLTSSTTIDNFPLINIDNNISSCITKYSGGFRGAPPARGPPPTAQKFLDFMQFFGNSDKIVCWHPPLEGRRPLLQGILDPPLKYMWQFRVSTAISPCSSATVVKPYGLGYRCRALTHLFFRIANGGPQGSHLNIPSNGASAPAQAPRMRTLPKFSIKVGRTTTRGSLFG